MKSIEFKTISELSKTYDVFLFDLWGVIINNDIVSQEIIDTLHKLHSLGKEVFFLTNAPRPRNRIFQNLIEWNMKYLSKKQVFTSGDITLDLIHNASFLNEHNLTFENLKIYHLGQDRNLDLFNDLHEKLTNNIEEANIVCLSLYRDSQENLHEFDDLFKYAIKYKKLIICANPDFSIIKGNTTRYCSGYFAKKILDFGGDLVYAGKPECEIFDKAISSISNIEKKKIIMIGDSFETDILGANQINIDSGIVLTGNAQLLFNSNDDLSKKINQITRCANERNIYPQYITHIV